MDFRKIVVLLSVVIVGVAGCGARTGLEDFANDAPRDAVAVDTADTRQDVTDVAQFFSCNDIANPGDLLRAGRPESSAVYFIGDNCFRYVFPNENTYFSWYGSFSDVRWILSDTLATIIIGGNVTIRPGTLLIKIYTDPKVYAITRCGVIHWIPSEDMAMRLYGQNWARRTRDVPDGFFVNYTLGYTLGDMMAEPVHPDGTLISYAGSSDVYVMSGGQRRRFAPGAFEANRFQRVSSQDPSLSFVIETTIQYPDGLPVLGRESELERTVCEP